MEKISVQKDRRYVVAVMDTVPMFLSRDFSSNAYVFTDNISRATKCVGREAASDLIQLYRRDNFDERSITVLPIEVSYELIDE